MRLKLGATTADGYVSGYYDVWKWYLTLAKNGQRGVGGWEPAAILRSLVKHADGYKYPKNGQCTATSGTCHIQTVRAFIVKDDKPTTVSANQSGETQVAATSR